LEIIFGNLAVTVAGPTEIFQQHDAHGANLRFILVINGGQSRPHLGTSLQGCGWRSIEPLYTAKVFVRLQANLPMRYLLTRG
jgi:hypothetical protein